MPAESFKRKLTAILSADVKGYSRLMGEDEAETVKTITSYRKIMGELIHQHRGRVVDSPGDNVLAEFASVVDAVQCAVAAQNEFKARNADLPENRRMQFRIGINLGDVIEEGERIYGDGVNIAARLEALADPGGICVSKTAFDQIETKLPLGYEFLGEQEVKNIAKPVEAYRVLMEPRITVVGAVKKKVPSRQRRLTLVIAGILILLVGALALWQFALRPAPPSVEKADPKKMAFPLPDKPSVAVLPFANMSDDPKQEYLADGITENIISALSKVPNLFVIARNSTFTYKGKPVKVQQVAEELGIRYVLEGSVQRSGDTLRITTQLIDAITGHHVWSERYDRELKQIFALQDDITLKVVNALEVKLTEGEQARLSAKKTTNLQAYLKLLQAREGLFRVTREGNAEARRLLEEVMTLDPQFPTYGFLASIHFMDVSLGISKSPGESLKQALELIKKAIAVDDADAGYRSLLGWLYVYAERQYDKGIAECERAITLAPNSASSHIWMGLVLTYAGRHEEAIRHTEQALRLDPIPPGWYYRNLGLAYFNAGRYEEAIATLKKSLNRAPNDLITHLNLTTTYSWAGRHEEASAQAAEVLKIHPSYSVAERAKLLPYKNQAELDRFLEGLRKAGLPDKPLLPLPDKPAIAVLPFVNMSDDPKQEYFSDGLSEGIITALAKVPQLFVIGRDSTFSYKGRAVKANQVSEELGVQYVLEGSVQRAGDRVRVTAQLIDALKGHHLWAERYDRELKDVFAILDEITKHIITSLQVKLTHGESVRIVSKGTQNLDAYLKVLEANWYTGQSTRENIDRARQLAEEAIAMDPGFAFAYRALGGVHMMDALSGFSRNARESLELSDKMLRKAIEVDGSLAAAPALRGFTLVMLRRYDEAVTEVERAYELAPNDQNVIYWYGTVLSVVGRAEEAIPLLKEALRLNPRPPNAYFRSLGMAHREAGRYEEAVAYYKRATDREPDDVTAQFILAATCIMAGREEEARAAAKEALRLNPKFSVERYMRTQPLKDPAARERFAQALRKAGLPD